MKDVRGAHVSAIRTAILKTYGLQVTTTRSRKNSRDLLEWKKSKEVATSYERLFTEEDAIEKIAISAFPSLNTSTEEVFSDMYIYTAAVCDIILNPDIPVLEVTKKPLELRMRRFKVFVEFTFLKLSLLIEN